MNRSPAGRDTRQHPRVDVQLAVSVSDPAGQVRRLIKVPAADLSSGGTFLCADVLFEVGEVLMVEFDLPGSLHVRVQGRVVRVARGGQKDKQPGMGIEFLDLSPEDRAAIDARRA